VTNITQDEVDRGPVVLFNRVKGKPYARAITNLLVFTTETGSPGLRREKPKLGPRLNKGASMKMLVANQTNYADVGPHRREGVWKLLD